jgi:hypothetical protein
MFPSITPFFFVAETPALELSIGKYRYNEIIPPFVPELLLTGVLTSLRLLFARQAKGKRKLVIWRYYANHDRVGLK